MIIYYTGTGNSKYVADMMADILDDEAVSANEYIKNGIAADFASDKPYVFVSPVYVSAPARIFEDFVRSGSFGGNKKTYFVMTCAGGMGACPAYCEKLSGDKFDYMGTAQVEMPQNYLVFFTTKEKEENEKTIAAAEPKIKELAQLVAEGKAFPDSGMKKWELISTEMILAPYYKWFMKAKAFTVSDDCVGCGLCAKTCPLGNIKIVDKKPVWGDNCTHCVSCINRCPKKAIEYGKKSLGKPRYVCPEYKKK